MAGQAAGSGSSRWLRGRHVGHVRVTVRVAGDLLTRDPVRFSGLRFFFVLSLPLPPSAVGARGCDYGVIRGGARSEDWAPRHARRRYM